MKNAWIVLAAVLGSATAQADGFVCRSPDLTVKVYNKTDASEGTRSSHVMVVSDPSIAYGRKTIARFLADEERLASSGATYAAVVDLRYADTARKGENIAGTKLGQISTLTLDVDFSYANAVENGEELPAELLIEKRDGSEIAVVMTCERYLKN